MRRRLALHRSVHTLTPIRRSDGLLRAHGRKVLVIRWDGSGFFMVVTFEPGFWEQEPWDWPKPEPFD